MKCFRKRIEKNKERKLLAKRDLLLRSLTVAGLALAPFALPEIGHAGNITRTGSNTNLMQGNKAEVYAGWKNSKLSVGVNSFKTYKVSKNEIANMYFATENDKTNSVDTLVNVVGSRIDVNGTVNAIRDNKIGGHMYFLSKDGMVVGGEGAINAGQLTVITPRKNLEFTAGKEESFLTDFTKVASGEVALNEYGTIVVLGSINTAGGVSLNATHVQVGGSHTYAPDEDKPKEKITASGTGVIRTGVDFSNLVNTKSLDVNDLKGSVVNTALAEDKDGKFKLTFTAAKKGDEEIITLTNHDKEEIEGDASVNITAKNAYNNYYDEKLGGIYTIKAFSGNNTIKSDVALAEKSEISALGDVSINVTASNDPKSFMGYWGFDVTEWSVLNLFNSGVYAVNADIKVDGNITGRTVDIAANAHATFDNTNNKGMSLVKNGYDTFVKGKFADVEKLNTGDIFNFLDSVDVSVGFVNTKANVKVGKNSVINATGNKDFERDKDKKIKTDEDTGLTLGGALRIVAVSSAETNAEETVQNPSYDDAGKLDTDVSDLFNVVGIYTEAVSDAEVIVEGELDTKGAALVTAMSSADSASSAGIARPDCKSPDPDQLTSSGNVNLAGAIARIDDDAVVQFKEGSSLTAGGSVQLAASAEDSIGVSAKIATDENALVNVGAGLAIVASDTKVDINGSITGADIDVSASETVKKNKLTVNSSVGSDDNGLWTKADKAIWKFTSSKYFKYATEPISTLINGYADKDVNTFYDPTSVNRFADVGATFGIEVGHANSTISIGPKGILTSTVGDISLDSSTLTQDSYFSVQNIISNKDTRGETKAMVSASIGVVDFDAKANIVVEGKDGVALQDGTTIPQAAIKSAGALNLNASSVHDYGRWDAQLKSITGLWRVLKEVGVAAADAVNALGDIIEYCQDYDDADLNARIELAGKWEKAWMEIGKLKIIEQPQAVQDAIAGIPGTVKNFIAPSNYVQFYVANATGANLYKEADPATAKHQLDSKFAFAGSVGINDLSNTANIVIGKNVLLKAEGEIEMNAEASRTSSAIYGKVMNSSGWLLPKLANTSGAANGLGVTIGIDSNDLASTIAVAENAEIEGSDITLKADNHANDIAFTFGGADTVNNSGSGMLHVMGGNSNAIVLVDDEAKLTGSELNIDAVNKIIATNAVGDFNRGAATSIGFGIGVNDYDIHTIASVADNDFDNSSKEEKKKKTYTNRKGEEVEDLLNLLQTNLSDKEFTAANFGTVAKKINGEINATELKLDAASTGVQNVLAIAGVASGSKSDGTGIAADDLDTDLTRRIQNANANTGWQITVAGSTAVTVGENETAALLEGTKVNITPEVKTDEKGENPQLVGSVELKAKDDIYTGAYSGGAALSLMSANNQSNKETTLAGALAFNKLQKNTVSQIKNVSITDALEIRNKAENSGAQVAIGIGVGAAVGEKLAQKGFDLAMSVSANNINTHVHANILDTNIASDIETLTAPTMISNVAGDKDVQVSGGVGVEFSRATAAVGGNLAFLTVKNDVKAELGNTTADNGKQWDKIGNIQNYAYSKLTQVSGAVSVGINSGEGSKFSGAATYIENDITNTLAAEINNADIIAKSLDNQAFDGLISTSEAQNEYVEKLKTQKVHKFENVKYTYNEKGEITDIDYTHTTEQREFVDTDGSKIVNAATEDENGNSTLKTINTSEEGIGKLTEGYDPTAKGATSAEELHKGLYKSETITMKNEGNVQVGFAISGAIRNTDGTAGVAAGAAIVNNKFKNTFDSNISGGAINITGTDAKDSLKVGANNKTNMVGVAVGVAFDNMSTKGGVVEGSGVGQNVENNIKAKIENATIDISAKKLDVTAKNEAKLVALTGQATLTGGTNLGLGLAVSNNVLSGTTGAYILGSDIKGSQTGVDVKVDATNTQNSDAWAIGGTYNKQPEGGSFTAEGTHAANESKNNTEAIIDQSVDAAGKRVKNSMIIGAGDISVTTKDESHLTAVAGAVSAAKVSVAMGGAWAQNNIGESADKKQHNTAAIRNTEIRHVAENKNIIVNAIDDAANAYAVALGGSAAYSENSKISAEGTVAVNKQFKDINAEFVDNIVDVDYIPPNTTDWKDVLAAAQNTDLQALIESNKNANLEVKAKSDEKNVTSADGIGLNISGNGAAGAGIAYNTSDIDTTALVSNSVITANDVKVLAENTNKSLNVGIGASVAAQLSANKNFGGTIEFNLADNNIDNDVTAKIEKSKIEADNNVVVDASGHEKLNNFVGGLGVNFGTQKQFAMVSAGAGVALNTITSDIAADVDKSNITAYGKGASYKVKEYNEKDNSHGEIDDGVDKEHNGLVVNAKGDHDLWNLVLDGGFIVDAGGSTIKPNLNVSVSRNEVKGSTAARVTDTDVNDYYTPDYVGGAVGDIYVNSYDDMDITNRDVGIVGNLDFGDGKFSLTAGAAASTNTIDRTNTAAIAAGDDKIANVNANAMTVKALSHEDIYTADAGVAIDIAPGGTVQITNSDVVSVLDSGYTTKAYVKNVHSNNNGMNIKADLVEKVKALGVGIDLSVGNFDYHKASLSVGAGVGVLNVTNANHTEAGIIGSNVLHLDENAEDFVKANTNVKLEATQAQASAVFAIYGAALNAMFTDSDIDDFTGVTVAGTQIGAKEGSKAKAIHLEAKNNLKGEFNNGAGALATLGAISGMENFSKVDTTTKVTVDDSKLYAKDIEAKAEEKLDIDALAVAATVGGIDLTINRGHINIGTGVEEKYAKTLEDAVANIEYTNAKSISLINAGLNGLNEQLKQATSKKLTSLNKETVASKPYTGAAATFNKGGVGMAVQDLSVKTQAGNQGTRIDISQSLLDSENDIKLTANRTSDANMDIGQGTIEVLGATVALGEIIDKHQVGISVDKSTLNAKNIAMDVSTDGTLDSTLVQAYVNVGNYSHAVSTIEITGENKVSLNDASLNSEGDIAINVLDETKAENHTVGAGVRGLGGGYLLSEIKDFSNAGVDIKGSSLQSATSATNEDGNTTVTGSGNISVDATKHNYYNSRITIGQLSGINISGAYSYAIQGELDDKGYSKNGISYINIDGTIPSTLVADTISLNAVNKTKLRAVSTFAGVDLLDLFKGTYSYGWSYGGATVNVGADNNLYASEIKAKALADVYNSDSSEAGSNANDDEDKYNIYSFAQGVNAVAAADINVNKAEAVSKQTVKVDFGTADVYGKTYIENENAKADKNANLTLEAINRNKFEANVKGVTGVGVIAFGSSKAFMESANRVETNIISNSDKTLELNKLQINAENDITSYGNAQGEAYIEGLTVKPYGAYVVNNSYNNVNANIQGKITTEDALSVSAHDALDADFTVDSATVVSIVDIVGTGKLENTVRNQANINIENSTLTSGSIMDLNANSSINIGKNKNSSFVSSMFLGILGFEKGSMVNDIVQDTKVDIKNSTLTSQDALNVKAFTDDYIFLHGRNDDVFDLAGLSFMYLNNDITTNNNITVGSDSNVKVLNANKDLTMAAWDDLDLYADVAASTSGFLDGTHATMDNDVYRNNTIAIAGNVYGQHDVNLYAGKTDKGNDGVLHTELTTMASNYSVSSMGYGTISKINNNINQNNKINVGTSGEVTSLRDANLYAYRGHEYISAQELTYKGIGWNENKESIYSSTKNDAKVAPVHNNEVVTDGKVLAGASNKILIVIGADANGQNKPQLVLLDENEKKLVTDKFVDEKDLVIYVDAEGTNIKGTSDGFKYDEASKTWSNGSFKLSVEDYGNQLQKRWENLNELISDYSGDRTSTAYLGYLTEIARVENLMVDMGLLIKNADGTKKLNNGTTSINVDTISLPDIVAGGGNVNVHTDYLHGAGSIEAKGTPEVTINNNTNMMLKVNKIEVQHPGGVITYNDKVVTGNDAEKTNFIAEINKKNNAKHTGSVAKVVSANTVAPGKVTINGNWDSVIHYNIEGEAGSAKPIANILVADRINVDDGSVEITSAANSIIIEGGAIGATNVKLIATKGSLSQGYVDGILSIAGNGSVEKQFSEINSGLKSEFNVETYGKDVKTSDGKGDVPSGTEYILGENIYISAADVNINGTVQSGFSKYELTVENDKETQGKIADIIDGWERTGKGSLSDYEVVGNADYRIVTGSLKLDTDSNSEHYGTYVKTLSAYYNPYTQKVIVEDVDNKAGQIYISGRISSTGNGKLVVADGAYDISVNNKVAEITRDNVTTDVGLQLGKLVVNDMEGKLTIADAATKKITEITRKGTAVYDMTNPSAAPEMSSTILAEYAPKEGLRYNWSSGARTGVVTKYERTDSASWWGTPKEDLSKQPEIRDKIKNQLESWESKPNPEEKPEQIANDPLKNGTYIGTVEGIDTNKSFGVVFDNKAEGDLVRSDPSITVHRHGYLDFYTDHVVRWETSQTTMQSYTSSAKADYGVAIKFSGNGSNDSTVDVKSVGDIDIAGNIGNTKLYAVKNSEDKVTGYVEKGTVNITSTNGDIYGRGGTIYGADVALNANNVIEDVQLKAGDTVNLTAVTHDKNALNGKVSVNVLAAVGAKGDVVLGGNIIQDPTDPEIALAFGGLGADKVTLTTQGNIINSHNGEERTSYIAGQRIDLEATDGAVDVLVDSGKTPLEGDLRSASVNVHAAKDIAVEEIAGDMRIGTIYSDDGDVNLVSNGRVIDALDYDGSIGNISSASLIEKWTNLGLITEATTENSAIMRNQQKIVDEYAQNVRNLFEEYKKSTDTESERYKSLDDKFKGFDSATQFLAQDKAYQEIQVKNLGMNKDKMLFSIADSVINQDPSQLPTSSSKMPNVRGNNISITAGDDIGLYDTNPVTIKLSELKPMDDPSASKEAKDAALEKLKLMSMADASNAEWHLTKTEDGKSYSDDSYVVIHNRLAVGIQTNTAEGKINLDTKAVANKEIFVEGRTEDAPGASQNKTLSLDKVMTDKGDIYISSLGDIANAHGVATEPAVVGKDLVIRAAGNIGSEAAALTTDLAGSLLAVANGNIKLEQVSDNDLALKAIAAKDDIDITAKNNIYMVDDTIHEYTDGAAPVPGYINSTNDGNINIISTEGSLGIHKNEQEEDEKKALLIKNSNSKDRVINLAAAQDIYAEGISSIYPEGATAEHPEGIPAGIMNVKFSSSVGEAAALNNVDLYSNGYLMLADADATTKESISLGSAMDLEVNGKLASKDVNLMSKENVKLLDGSIEAEKVAVKAGETIIQASDQMLAADNVQLEAATGISIISENNKLHNIAFYNSGEGNVVIINGAQATENTVITGAGKHLGETEEGVIEGKVNIVAKANNLVNEDEFKARDNAALIAEAGSIQNNGRVTSENETVNFIAQDNVSNTGIIVAEKDLIINAGDSIVNQNSLTSKAGDIHLLAGQTIINGDLDESNEEAVIYAHGNVDMLVSGDEKLDKETFYGVVNYDSIFAGNSVLFAASYEGETLENEQFGAVENIGDIAAGYTFELNKEGKVINLDRSVPIEESDGAVNFIANGDINNKGDILAYKSVDMVTDGKLVNEADITAQTEHVDLVAFGDVENKGGAQAIISAGKDVALGSLSGNVNNSASIISKDGEVYIAAAAVFDPEYKEVVPEDKGVPADVQADVVNDGSINAKNKVTIVSYAGNVTNTKDIISQEAGVEINAGIDKAVFDKASDEEIAAKGHITNTGNITTANDIKMDAFNSLYNAGSLDVKGDGNITVLAGVKVAAGDLTGESAEGLPKSMGNLLNAGQFEIEGQGSINLLARNYVENMAVMEAQYGNIGIGSVEGNVYNYQGADLYAGGGNVTLKAMTDKAETYYVNNKGEKVAIDRGDAANFREVSSVVNGMVNRIVQYLGNDGEWHDVIATGVIYNSGDAMALGADGQGGAINFISNHGSIYNYDDFSTLDGNVGLVYKRGVGAVTVNTAGGMLLGTDNVELSAKEGFLYNEKNIIANENVKLTAKYGLSNFAYDVLATGNIDLVATDGNLYNNSRLVSETGDINLKAENGTVVNLLGGDIFALGGGVNIVSGASKVDEKGELKPNANTVYTVDSGYVYTDETGKYHSDSTGKTSTLMDMLPEGTEIAWPDDIDDRIVTVDKYYLVGGTGEAKLIDQTVVVNALSKAEQESIYAIINVVDDKGTPVRLLDTQGNELKVNGNVDVFRLGDTINRGDLVAMGTTKVNEAGEIESVKPGTVHLRSEHGNVVNYDNFAMIDGATSMENKYEYDRTGKKYVLSTAGIGMEAPEGYFYNNLDYYTDGDLVLLAKKDMTIGDNFTITKVGGDIKVTSTEGKVTNLSESLEAGHSVILTGKTGVVNEGPVTGKTGNVEFISDAGNIVNKDDVQAGAEVTFKGQGITTEGNVNAQEHILMDAAKGDLSINGSIQNETAGIELYAKDGQIDIDGNVNAGSDGLLRIYAEQEAAEASEEPKNAVVVKGEIGSLNGSLDIGAENGNVDLKEADVTAGEMAAVGTKNGNVIIGEISAGTVVLYNDDPKNTVEADKIVAGESVVVQSAKPVIKQIEAASGTEKLKVIINGVGGKVDPEGEVTIGNKEDKVDYDIANLAVGTAHVYTAGNISIGNLYVNSDKTTDVVAKEGVAIDSLTVKEKVYASGYGNDASVYGRIPEYDGSNAIYYSDKEGSVESGKVKLDLEDLFFGKLDDDGKYIDKQPAVNNVLKEIRSIKNSGTKGTGKGTSLYIDDKHNQTSNAKLLHYENDYYVHSQRYSAEDLSRIIADEKALDIFDLYQKDNLVLFERYDLYELPALELVNGQLQNTLETFVLAKDEKKAK